MARPVSIQDDTIVTAARRIFLKRGFRAPTAEIARAAGVSEGSLFKRFPTKSALFMAAMDVETRGEAWQEELLRSAAAGDPEAALLTAGRHILHHARTILPRILMVHSSGVTVATDYYQPRRPPVLEHMETLARYFAAAARRGPIVCAAPEATAHAFIGAIQHYVICDVFHRYRPVPEDDYIRSVVRMVLCPARAAPAGGAFASRRKRPARRAKGGRS